VEKNYLAIEIGGTKLQIVIGDQSATIKERIRYDINKSKGAIGIQSQIEEGVKKLKAKYEPVALGVGFGGPINSNTGEIITSHQIQGWTGFNLKNWLKTIVNIPVFVENDANLAALGEAIHGAGKKFSKVFYVTLGSGVGGGFIDSGEVYHGAIPGEAEIGHIRLDKQGNTIELKCSGWAVDQKVIAYTKQNPESVLAKLAAHATAGQARFINAAIEKGDKGAENILIETADDIAFGFSHAVHLFHPEIIIVGGGLSAMGEILRKSIASSIPNYILKAFLPGPAIVLAGLGEDVVPIGALELAIRKSK
jgi:glucokinase